MATAIASKSAGSAQGGLDRGMTRAQDARWLLDQILGAERDKPLARMHSASLQEVRLLRPAADCMTTGSYNVAAHKNTVQGRDAGT
mmetsp:Transcript_21981/g.34901  ORF Transcript_21981/g.34901 Transcript_21981/m.34901 type:complete len:86 (+) Transcript_21981:553-810(+)